MYVCTCIIIIIMGGMNTSELVNKNKTSGLLWVVSVLQTIQPDSCMWLQKCEHHDLQ